MIADLVAFIEARLAEDEVIAGLAAPHESSELTSCDDSEALHIYAGRMLRECEAKRALRALYRRKNGGSNSYSRGWHQATVAMLRLLTLPYADHVDYRPEWRPDDDYDDK